MKTSRIRTYSELTSLRTFEERFAYLSIRGEVGCATFGGNRWINQQFYTSPEWRRLRHYAISRDEGCDLAAEGYEIHDRIIVHHMNPVNEYDIVHGTARALDLDNLICTTHNTHNAIHYGDASLLVKPYSPRGPGDTKLW
jgi:hypothetical protein